MKHRRAQAALLLCALLPLLAGCASPVTDGTAAVTMPPVTAPYAAPVADAELTCDRTVSLYLPSLSGDRLLARTETVTMPRDGHGARQVVQALLSAKTDGETAALGGAVTLSLYGRSPVEVSGDICTVNLTPATLELESDRLYTVLLALAATLEEACGIHRVNLLVADLAVGFDVAGNLPAGSVSARVGEELSALWSQLDAKKTPLGQSAASVPLTTVATLYFPLSDGSGIQPEARSLTFPGQSASQLALTLVEALSSGAQTLAQAAPMPAIANLLLAEPEVSDLADGGRIVALRFDEGLDVLLTDSGVDYTCFLAALNATLTTFIPQLGAVRVFVGNTMLTALSDERLGRLTFEYGVQRRRQLIPLLRDGTTVYLTDGRLLVTADRPVEINEHSLRAAFESLTRPVSAQEAAQGLSAALPDGLDATDLLAFDVVEETLLVSLSPRLERLIRQQVMDERLLCYSLVTTLCEAADVRRVRFFFEQETRDSLGGELAWDGEFLYNPQLLRTGN